MKNENKILKNCISIILAIMSLFVLGIIIIGGTGRDIWYDEVFSMGMSVRSFSDIIRITAQDVHPPLYYFYLKIIHDITGFLTPYIAMETIGKLASILPVAGLLLTALLLIRKKLGTLCMGVFSLLLVTMPQLDFAMVEIRMYSLAMFFITLAFLRMYQMIQKEEASWGDYVLFYLLGMATAYTQYYACIAVMALYLALLFWIILKKRKADIKKWVVFVALSIVGYLPWIPTLMRQYQKVSMGYWIEPMSFRSLFGCVKYIYLPVSYYTKLNYAAAVCMLIVTLILLIFFVRSKTSKQELFFVFSGLFVLAFVVLCGFVLSFINRPVFVYRYMIPCLGVFWLVIAFLFEKEWQKRWSILLILPFMVGGFLSVRGFYREEHNKAVKMEETQRALQEIPEDAVIVTNFDHVTAVSSYYLTNDIYLFEADTDPLIPQMLENCKQSCNEEQILEWLNENKTVYFFGSFQSREDLILQWNEKNITAQEEKSCLMERYWFNIYKLGVK